MWQSCRFLCSVNGCTATKGALRSLRRPRCHSNLKTDDKVFHPLLLCSLLKRTRCNKILLSLASVQSLVEYLSLFSGSCPPPPHMGELCRGMLDTCLPRIPSLKGQLCVLGLTSPRICFRISPNDADLMPQSSPQITQPLAAESRGTRWDFWHNIFCIGRGAPVGLDLESECDSPWYFKPNPSVIPLLIIPAFQTKILGLRRRGEQEFPLQVKESFRANPPLEHH